MQIAFQLTELFQIKLDAVIYTDQFTCYNKKRSSSFKNGNFFQICTVCFLKTAYHKRKEFAPTGSKFFPFMTGPFSEGRQNNFDENAFSESVSIPLIHSSLSAPWRSDPLLIHNASLNLCLLSTRDKLEN